MQKKITHVNKKAVFNSMKNRSYTIGGYNHITYGVNGICIVNICKQ